MKFIGNKKAVNILQRSIQNKTLGHAYLFSGPEKVGKFTLAKMFALNVIAGEQLNLDVSNVNKDALLDLVIVEPEILEKKGVLKQRDISIESIRNSKQSLSLYPYHGKYKILVINDAHRMTIASQNALLKILEEPNPTTIIILVTHEIDRILPTILSRLQIINFGLVENSEMIEGFSDDFSFSIDCVEFSIGRPGLAKFLNENTEEKIFRIEALDELKKIRKGSLNEKFKLAENLSKDSTKTLDKLNIWMWELRKNALLLEEKQRSEEYVGIEKIQQTMTMLKRSNANARLVLETLLMDL